MRVSTTIRTGVLAVVVTAALASWALRGVAQPTADSFASRIERLSEEGGDFDTDNLISNERTFLDVVPALKMEAAPGGAYVGVGPDQNFSYIGHIRPSIAFIVDIRRDNLLLHLLFKALFAASHTRVEYLSLLTGRIPPPRLDSWRTAGLDRVVAYVETAKMDSPEALERLDRQVHDAILGYGVPLGAADFRSIQRFHHTFVASGLSLKFESRGRRPQSVYPTFRDLIVATDSAGRASSYFAAEDDFQFVKSLEAKDLIIPVIGDLGGTRALAAIADFMAARGDKLSAFYISNIETYLYGDKFSKFVENVRKFPLAERSTIIRSSFRASISTSSLEPVRQFLAASR
jgi:hypothetical protein